MVRLAGPQVVDGGVVLQLARQDADVAQVADELSLTVLNTWPTNSPSSLGAIGAASAWPFTPPLWRICVGSSE